MAETAVKFEDVHAHDAETWYVVPNEHLGIWTDLVAQVKVERAAGICSSGEVGFFSMLPQVREELVLVDHSYRSLCIAMCKYMVMNELGVTKAVELFASGDGEQIKAQLDKVVHKLPPKIVEAYNKLYARQGGGQMASHSFQEANLLAMEYKALPVPLARKAKARFDKVTFLHGDLTDLKDRGPFDLLYLSNALEHTSRTGNPPLVDQVFTAVKPGGHVITAYPGSYEGRKYTRIPESWEEVASLRSQYNNENYSKISWVHALFKLPEAA